jgi:hypothetical protein
MTRDLQTVWNLLTTPSMWLSKVKRPHYMKDKHEDPMISLVDSLPDCNGLVIPEWMPSNQDRREMKIIFEVSLASATQEQTEAILESL